MSPYSCQRAVSLSRVTEKIKIKIVQNTRRQANQNVASGHYENDLNLGVYLKNHQAADEESSQILTRPGRSSQASPCKKNGHTNPSRSRLPIVQIKESDV